MVLRRLRYLRYSVVGVVAAATLLLWAATTLNTGLDVGAARRLYLELGGVGRELIGGWGARGTDQQQQQQQQHTRDNRTKNSYQKAVVQQKKKLSRIHDNNESDKVTRVVLTSSLPRSGSTFLSEVLTSHKPLQTVLFFEPLMLYQKTPCMRDGSCVPGLITRLLNCDFDEDFDKWLKEKVLFLNYYHPYVRRCFQKPREGSTLCRRFLDLRSLCHQASIRVVKVIRSKLSWMAELLEDSALNIKVIHLTRDPRGSIKSIKSMGWNNRPSFRCQALQNDLTEYDKLITKHPQKLFHVAHERMCLDPLGTTESLNRFIHGSSNLRDSTHRFLKHHTLGLKRTRPNNMETRRNSAAEYDAWRWEITEKELKEVEGEAMCRGVVARMGHIMFTSLDKARNASIKLAILPA